MRKERKHYIAEEKVAILRRHLLDNAGNGRIPKTPGRTQRNGKKRGARIVYIWPNEEFPVFLIPVFPKNEKENLSMAERPCRP
jgi:hypothetical protein